MIGCIKRIKKALSELSDKTLPEEDQMKILNILIRFYNSYSQVCSVKSHKIGDSVQIDLHLAFEKDTRYEEIVKLNKQMQAEFDSQFDNCVVNIIVAED
jgi:divalent metal cation (Fe/Co/Zn/Cd) transporter